jgi:hypothetical protein
MGTQLDREARLAQIEWCLMRTRKAIAAEDQAGNIGEATALRWRLKKMLDIYDATMSNAPERD